MTPPGSCDKGGWGYRLPQHPNDKGARAAYRAVAHKCLMFDMSYLGCLEVRDHKTNTWIGLQFNPIVVFCSNGDFTHF